MASIKLLTFGLSLILAMGAAAQSATKTEPGATPVGGPVSVFDNFPTRPDYYAPEVAALVEDGVIERWGEEEWRAIVVSHEMHQHIGVYTVLGAKMGVHARELLDAPRRVVDVTVATLTNTPMACAADGLQTALGSTYGQHLMRLTGTQTPDLRATFRYAGQALCLRLKPAIQREIANKLADARERHGGLTRAYFDEVREESYRVWAEYDRNEIFDVCEADVANLPPAATGSAPKRTE